MNRTRFVSVLFLLATLVISGCTQSKTEDTPAKRKALAIQVAQIALSNGYYDAIMGASIKQGMQLFAAKMQANLGRELTHSEYKKFKRAFAEAFRATYPSHIWVSRISDLYAKHFNSDNLAELLVFYKTETGQKLLSSASILTKEGAKMGIKLIESNEDEFIKSFQQNLSKYANKP